MKYFSDSLKEMGWMITEKTCNRGYNGFLQYFRFVTKLCDKYLINHFAKDANSSPKSRKRERQGILHHRLCIHVRCPGAVCPISSGNLFSSSCCPFYLILIKYWRKTGTLGFFGWSSCDGDAGCHADFGCRGEAGLLGKIKSWLFTI